MDREDFISSLSNGVVVLGGCGIVGSLIARILASHNIDVTIKDSVSETFLEPIFKNEGVHLCLSHQLDNNSFNNISAIFIAPSLLNNKIFMGKVNNFNTNNLPIYSIDEILTYFTPDKPVIGVTGTNGKSTTTHSLKHIFSVNGYKVPSHGLPIQGNNEYTPSLQSRLSGDIGILEIGTFGIAGEIYTSASNSHVNMGVITNITHDHLNNGSYEDYINCKKEMIQVADELVLDGDDPTLLNIVETDNKKIYYFGIKDMDNPLFKDSKYNMTCPKCGCKLKYDIHYLRSLGEFNCECGFTNPPLNVYADNIQIIKENNITKTSYTIHFEDQESATINLPNSGIHNVYNSLAAACAAWKSGLDIDQIIKGIESFNADELAEIIQWYGDSEDRDYKLVGTTKEDEEIYNINETVVTNAIAKFFGPDAKYDLNNLVGANSMLSEKSEILSTVGMYGNELALFCGYTYSKYLNDDKKFEIIATPGCGGLYDDMDSPEIHSTVIKFDKAVKKNDELTVTLNAIYLDCKYNVEKGNYKCGIYNDNKKEELIEKKKLNPDKGVNIKDYLKKSSTITLNFKYNKDTKDYYFVSSSSK